MPDCFYVIIRGSAVVLLPKDPELIYKEKEKIRQKFKKLQKEAEIKRQKQLDSLDFPESPENEVLSATLPNKKQSNVFCFSPKVVNPQNLDLIKPSNPWKSVQKIAKMMSFLNATSLGSLKQKLDQQSFLITQQMKNEVLALGLKIETLSNAKHYFDGQVFIYYTSGTLGPGQSFGELGLLRKKPRAATILCIENTHLGILQKIDYETIYYELQNQKLKNLIKFFKNSLDVKITNDTITKFAYLFEKQKILFGEKVYIEGEIAEKIYLIKKGEIELNKKYHEDSRKKHMDKHQLTLENLNKIKKRKNLEQNHSVEKTPIGIVRKGDYFGDEEVFLNIKRKYTAVCISSNATIYSIGKQVNLTFLQNFFLVSIEFNFLTFNEKSPFFRNFSKVLMSSWK